MHTVRATAAYKAGPTLSLPDRPHVAPSAPSLLPSPPCHSFQRPTHSSLRHLPMLLAPTPCSSQIPAGLGSMSPHLKLYYSLPSTHYPPSLTALCDTPSKIRQKCLPILFIVCLLPLNINSTRAEWLATVWIQRTLTKWINDHSPEKKSIPSSRWKWWMCISPWIFKVQRDSCFYKGWTQNRAIRAQGGNGEAKGRAKNIGKLRRGRKKSNHHRK